MVKHNACIFPQIFYMIRLYEQLCIPWVIVCVVILCSFYVPFEIAAESVQPINCPVIDELLKLTCTDSTFISGYFAIFKLQYVISSDMLFLMWVPIIVLDIQW